MSRIICGMFDRTIDADAALEELKRAGFQRAEIDAFYVSPPGQHAMTPVGGDATSSEGSRTAGIEWRAIEILRGHSARDVRRAEGEWSDGAWRDFDPRAPLAAV